MKVTAKNNWSDTEVEAHWDRVASIYVKENEKVKSTHDQRFHETLLHLKLDGRMKILNITSRDAGADEYIRRDYPGAEVINAEISGGLIEVARRLRPEIRQVKLDSYAELPFTDAAFDRVVSLETLEHVAEPLKFLAELHRVSKADAIMVLSCPPATSELPYRLYTALFGGHGEGPHRFLPSREVKAMLAMTGWKLILHKGTLLIPVGPASLKKIGEWMINRCQGTFIAELGIRQFYVCEKA